MNEPDKRLASVNPNSVMSGLIALRTACFHTTVPSGRPLARAVVT